MGIDTTVLLTLALIGAAALFWYSWRAWAKSRRRPGGSTGLTEDYIQGLNYLLNDQTDKAVDVFMRLLSVDSDTLETHFALGSLFRKRGEVDRAIRIHQNIIARPGLARRHKQSALLALADDFVTAGLYDRAEGVLQQLSNAPELRRAVLKRLAKIYESQQDWVRAVQATERLQTRNSDHSRLLSHYHCELAARAPKGGRQAEARAHLKRAQSQDRSNVRSALMRADIAIGQGDDRMALRLLRRAVETDPVAMRFVLPRLAALSDSSDKLDSTLVAWARKNPQLTMPLCEAALLSKIEPTAAVLDAFSAWLSQQDALAEFCQELVPDLSDPQRSAKLLEAFRRLLANAPGFQCTACGFEGSKMYWQCPGCQRWDGVRPHPVRIVSATPAPITAPITD